MYAQPGNVSFDMLVKSLAASAAAHLGDVADPVTGAKASPNPGAAAQMVDLLVLLEKKTHGNLDGSEVQFLTETLRVLRARLLEVMQDVASGAKPTA